MVFSAFAYRYKQGFPNEYKIRILARVKPQQLFYRCVEPAGYGRKRVPAAHNVCHQLSAKIRLQQRPCARPCNAVRRDAVGPLERGYRVERAAAEYTVRLPGGEARACQRRLQYGNKHTPVTAPQIYVAVIYIRGYGKPRRPVCNARLRKHCAPLERAQGGLGLCAEKAVYAPGAVAGSLQRLLQPPYHCAAAAAP